MARLSDANKTASSRRLPGSSAGRLDHAATRRSRNPVCSAPIFRLSVTDLFLLIAQKTSSFSRDDWRYWWRDALGFQWNLISVTTFSKRPAAPSYWASGSHCRTDYIRPSASPFFVLSIFIFLLLGPQLYSSCIALLPRVVSQNCGLRFWCTGHQQSHGSRYISPLIS